MCFSWIGCQYILPITKARKRSKWNYWRSKRWPLFELAVGQAIRKSFTTDPDALQYTIALKLVHDQLGVNHGFTHTQSHTHTSNNVTFVTLLNGLIMHTALFLKYQILNVFKLYMYTMLAFMYTLDHTFVPRFCNMLTYTNDVYSLVYYIDTEITCIFFCKT